MLITADQEIPYQQNLTGFRISILILMAATNRLKDLQPLMPAVLDALRRMDAGTVVVVRG